RRTRGGGGRAPAHGAHRGGARRRRLPPECAPRRVAHAARVPALNARHAATLLWLAVGCGGAVEYTGMGEVVAVDEKAERVTGTVTLNLANGRYPLPLLVRDDALEAGGPPLTGREVAAHVQLTREGQPIEMHFVLPVDTGAAGAAEVPLDGCVPPAPRPGSADRLPRCVLTFHQPVTAMAVEPAASTVLVAVVDGGVTAWRMPSAEFVLGFAPPPPIAVPGGTPPHPDAANAVAVSPDGREAVVAFENRLVVHATDSGRVLRELPALRGVVRTLGWSPDGKGILATVFYDAAAHLLAADDGREIRALQVEREGVGVAFTADSRV